MNDVEDIHASWSGTGILDGCQDPFNSALILETQRQVNVKFGKEWSSTFSLTTVAAMIRVCKEKPDMFQGLIDFHECCDVYRLGPIPRGTDAEICVALVMRILKLDMTGLYFGGLVAQNGKMYLLADWIN